MRIDYDDARHCLTLEGKNAFAIRDVLRQRSGKFEGGRWLFPASAIVDGLVHVLANYGARLTEVSPEASRITADIHAANEVKARGGSWRGPWTTSPYEHQYQGTSWLLANRRTMLLDEMGLGKTKEVIDAVRATTFGAFVVCPNSIRRSWAREIDLHSGSKDVLILEGTSKKRLEALCNTQARWVVVNYESLQWLEKTEPGVLGEWVKQRIVVFDEAHRLKNGLAKVTKLVSSWSPERTWLLTGTPIANKPEDLYSLVSLVRPGYLGWTWYQFERAHIIRGHFNEIKSYRGMDVLRDKLADVSMGRRKEACLDLPEKVYSTVTCELSPGERKAYEQMYESMIAWLDEQDLGPGDRPTVTQAATWATRYLRLRQITDGLVSEGAGGAMSWSEDLTKLRTAIEAWEDAGSPRAVVWYQWVPVGHKLEAMFRAAKANVFRVGGDVNPNNRDVMIEQWKEHGGVLLGQMAVAGEGLNLQAADWQMFVDLPSTPKQRKQCVDRLHRIDQKHTVRIVDVVAEKTVDEVVLKTLKKKLNIADDVESAAYGAGTDWRSMVSW